MPAWDQSKLICHCLTNPDTALTRHCPYPTHFYNLGDKIAIMKQGHIQASGSSFDLKKKHGSGYELYMEKQPISSTEGML